MLTTIVLYGVLIPALVASLPWLVSAFAAPERLRPWLTGFSSAFAGLGVAVAFNRIGGEAEWPVIDTTHWIYFGALFGVAAGLWDAAFRALGRSEGRGRAPAWLTWLRLAPALVVAVLYPKALYATLLEHTWAAEEASRWLWGTSAAILVTWLALDQAVERAGAFGGAVILTLFSTGASVAVVLGEFALGAQVVGAAAAATGGLAATALLARKRTPVVVGAAIPAVILVSFAALSAGHHYATLSATGLALVLAAPVLAAALGFVPALQLRWRATLQVVGLAGLLAAAGLTAHRAPEDTPGGEDDPYDYGYGYDDSDDSSSTGDYGAYGGYGGYGGYGDYGAYGNGGAGTGSESGSSDYGDYGALEGWTPPGQEDAGSSAK